MERKWKKKKEELQVKDGCQGGLWSTYHLAIRLHNMAQVLFILDVGVTVSDNTENVRTDWIKDAILLSTVKTPKFPSYRRLHN